MHPSAAAVSGNWQQQWLLLQMSMLVASGTACYSLGVLWVQHALHLRKLAGLLGFAHGLEWRGADSSRSIQQVMAAQEGACGTALKECESEGVWRASKQSRGRALQQPVSHFTEPALPQASGSNARALKSL